MPPLSGATAANPLETRPSHAIRKRSHATRFLHLLSAGFLDSAGWQHGGWVGGGGGGGRGQGQGQGVVREGMPSGHISLVQRVCVWGGMVVWRKS